MQQQVKNNIAKFEGEDFMFQLTASEREVMRCNFCTSSWGGIRYAPHVFTEQGIYMLMTVLRDGLTVKQNPALLRESNVQKTHIANSNRPEAMTISTSSPL
ncbi:MAG: ORF6N domain-containing protein [Eggerthellaceae bacterium]|nr:ORF6N domain-containing protein [Eggerthellaceae bacterium]